MTDSRIYKNEFRKETIRHILEDLSKGESLTLIGISGIGKSNTIYWLTQHASSQDSHIFLINLDFDNLVTVSELGFYRFFLLELYETSQKRIKDKTLLEFIKEEYTKTIDKTDELLAFNSIKKVLSFILEKTELTLCILLNGFEKIRPLHTSLFNTLLALRAINKLRVVFAFITNEDVFTTFTSANGGKLCNLLSYNIYWLKPLDENETYALAGEFAEILKTNLSDSNKKRIWELSGGYSWYIKDLVKIASEINDLQKIGIESLSQSLNIISRGQQIWGTLQEKHKEILHKIASNKSLQKEEIPSFLINTGLVCITKNRIKLFSPLFENFVLSTTKDIEAKDDHSVHINTRQKNTRKAGLTLDNRRMLVLKEGTPLRVEFSKNEFQLLKFLFNRKSEVVTRDEVSKELWGEHASHKYSDWAIDKIVSRLRLKIEENPKSPRYLLTIRGVGFKLKG